MRVVAKVALCGKLEVGTYGKFSSEIKFECPYPNVQCIHAPRSGDKGPLSDLSI